MIEVEDLLRNIAFPLLRFGAFASHALLFGLVPIALWVLRPAFAGLEGEDWEGGRRAVAVRLEGLVRAALVGATMCAALVMLLQAALVSELGDGHLKGENLASVLDTTFGRWTALRFPLLLALAVLLLGRVRTSVLSGLTGEKSPSIFWWGLWAVLACGLMCTSTFSGHALVGSPQILSLTNDLVHLIAGGIWFAGVIVLGGVLPEGWRRSRGGLRLRLLAPCVTNFSHVALIAIGVVAVTGTVNSFLHVGKFSDLWQTSYGQALSVKLLFFFGILALGGFNHYRVRDRLNASLASPASPAPATASSGPAPEVLFRRTIAAEVVLALAIMAASGVLTYLSRTA